MQHKKDCVFLGYSLGDSSVSDYFSSLALKFADCYHVLIITDTSTEVKNFPPEISVEKWPSNRPTSLKDFIFLRQLVKKYKPKMMLSLFGANNLFLTVGWLSKVPIRIGTYRTLSAQYHSTKFQRTRKQFVYKLATQVIVNSNATRDDLNSTYNTNISKILVLPNAVKMNSITNERDNNLIVYAGRLHKSKGISVLLESFASLLKTNANTYLKILGGTKSDVGYYQKEAKQLGISTKISFLGSVDKSEVLHWFSKARFVVVPSFAEAFGFVVIEAFSVGTPVIGSDTGGIKDSIRDRKDGFLVEPGNSLLLKEKMEELLKNDEVIEEMRKNCHENFMMNFELEASTQNLFANLHHQIAVIK